MSIVLEQPKQKWLTFEEICPLWTEALSTGQTDKKFLSINRHDCCIVGEAHGFKSGYAYGVTHNAINYNLCDICVYYSNQFYRKYKDPVVKGCSIDYGLGLDVEEAFSIVDHEAFERLKEGFVEHWNMEHVKKK